VDDRMSNECGTIAGKKITEETKVIGEDSPKCHCVHHKFHIT
jgi:hypothetical protein